MTTKPPLAPTGTITAFLTVWAFISPSTSVRKSSRRSDQRMPPRATSPAAEVHGLDARRVDEDLEHRPRLGQIRDELGIQLEREVRLRAATGLRLEVVRAQDCSTTRRKPRRMRSSSRLSTASIVAFELAARARLGFRVGVLEPHRVEAQPEELDEAAGDVGVRGERVLHVGLAERASRLAEVLRDRAEDTRSRAPSARAAGRDG